jgi:hypothetical protein
LHQLSDRLPLVDRSLELFPVHSELHGMSRKHVLRGRCVCALHGQHGVRLRGRVVSVQAGLYGYGCELPGVSGGDVQAFGGDVGVSKLSGE